MVILLRDITIGSVRQTDYSKFLNAMMGLPTSANHRLCHNVVVRGAEGCFRPSQKPAGHSPNRLPQLLHLCDHTEKLRHNAIM